MHVYTKISLIIVLSTIIIKNNMYHRKRFVKFLTENVETVKTMALINLRAETK